MLLKGQRFCLRHAGLVTALFFISSLLVLSQVSKMKIVFTAEDLAGDGFQSAIELKEIKERFQEGVTSTLFITPSTAQATFSVEELCAIRDWYSTLRVSLPDLKMTFSTFDFKWPVQTSPTRVSYRNILDLDCRKNVLFNPLKEVKDQLDSSPFGLAPEYQNQFSLLFQFIFHDSTTSKFGSFDPALVQSLRQSVEKDLLPRVSGIQPHWVGPADYQWYVLEGFKFSKWINLIMMLLIILCLRIFAGTWKAGLLYCATLIMTAIWIFGLKGLFGSSFDVLSTGLILILGISSLEDFVFICGEMIKGKTWKTSFRKILVPGSLTSVTTFIGFISLCVSDLEAIRRMGLWAAIGTVLECGIIFFILPAIFKTLRYKKTWAKSNKYFDYLKNTTEKTFSRKFAYFACLVFPLGFLMMKNFDYNESPQNIFPKDQEYRVSLDKLEKSKGWLGVASLLFDQKLSYEEAEMVIQLLLKDQWIRDFVVRYESPASIINWIEEQKTLPKQDARVHFNISGLHDTYVDNGDGLRSIFYLKETSVNSIELLKTKIASICQSKCHLAGEVVAYSDFSKLVPKSFMESLLVSLIFVSLVIWAVAIAVDQEKQIVSLLLSSFWGPFFMITVMGALHTRIDFWKSIFASVLVGLAGDNAIQYLHTSRKKNLGHGISDKGASSILTGSLMASISLVYLGSYFSSPKLFGVILFVGLLAVLAGDLWLLKCLLASNVNNKIEDKSLGHEVTSSVGSSKI